MIGWGSRTPWRLSLEFQAVSLSAPSPAGSDRNLDAFAGTEPLSVGRPSLAAESAAELVPAAIDSVLKRGHRVGGARPFLEILNQQLCQRDPRRRVFASAASSFNVAVAVARFVWHVGGNSKLSAIAFYEPRARLFSDDGEVLPGSNSGARLFGGGSGVDQIRGIVSRLREDASSRRGAAVAWRPEDAVRQSRDIPCTMAMTCHLRGGELITTVSMRSNNAVRLLPYNLFEYTMLAELIAGELDVDLGPYWHSASSLHVFEDEIDSSRAIASSPSEQSNSATPMPPMPRGEGALDQVAKLVNFEALLRAAVVDKNWRALTETIERAESNLPSYWFGLFCVLSIFATARAQAAERIEFDALLARTPSPLRETLDELLV